MARVAMAERGLRFSDLKRFVEKVEESPDGCWIWKGAAFHLPDGTYGAVSYCGNACTAHRMAYELFVGRILGGLHVDHLCGNTLCVNPDHLEAVTPKENTRRGLRWSKARRAANMKTHCKRGHPLSGQNLYVWHGKRGVQRTCKACAAERDREYRRRLKQVPPKGEERPGPMGECAEGVVASVAARDLAAHDGTVEERRVAL